jgi:hypothetical protein
MERKIIGRLTIRRRLTKTSDNPPAKAIIGGMPENPAATPQSAASTIRHQLEEKKFTIPVEGLGIISSDPV